MQETVAIWQSGGQLCTFTDEHMHRDIRWYRNFDAEVSISRVFGRCVFVSISTLLLLCMPSMRKIWLAVEGHGRLVRQMLTASTTLQSIRLGLDLNGFSLRCFGTLSLSILLWLHNSFGLRFLLELIPLRPRDLNTIQYPSVSDTTKSRHRSQYLHIVSIYFLQYQVVLTAGSS